MTATVKGGRFRIGKRGEKNRRHLVTLTIGGYEFTYHATKGWRRQRI